MTNTELNDLAKQAEQQGEALARQGRHVEAAAALTTARELRSRTREGYRG
jgi:hypothetical protein